MRENSIKEDIKIVENYLANSAMNEIDSNFFKNSGWEIVDLEIPKSMQHILSDYKRALETNEVLLKENEKLHKEIDQMKSLDIYKLVEDWETGQLIPIQKIKDKIEEIQEEGYWLFTTDRDSDKCVEFLQELLGKEE
mgnify:CR=1 FL=1